ncbi:uncharacterized protein LOC129583680 isoform X3 [Paramacrobiotus metropolitanus]|uniref:uncharacterized protein LOC129583680 isoform X3 n=1 Tax=Paramacrobiotus metropolitanus TaxID=2943436 RepID=UPI00244625DD|nr:uncharacterized protein LOC129583680 isoform X3 [Paramacrobiotus metropolitanus]
MGSQKNDRDETAQNVLSDVTPLPSGENSGIEELRHERPDVNQIPSEKNVGMRSSSVTIISHRHSGPAGSIMRNEGSIMGAGIRRSSRARNSFINPARDSLTTIRQRSRRNSLGPAHAQSSSARAPEEDFSVFFTASNTSCKLPNMNDHSVQNTWSRSWRSNSFFNGSFRHAHSTKIEEIFQNLDNPSSSFLEDTRIVLFLSDVPARIVNTFVLLPVDTAPTATVYSSGDVAAVAKDFVEKMVHFSLLLSTLYTLEEDEQVKNVSWSLEKAILNPELIDILIRSELTFPVSAFLQFYHGPLHLPRLGDEFEWAYPPGSTKN